MSRAIWISLWPTIPTFRSAMRVSNLHRCSRGIRACKYLQPKGSKSEDTAPGSKAEHSSFAASRNRRAAYPSTKVASTSCNLPMAPNIRSTNRMVNGEGSGGVRKCRDSWVSNSSEYALSFNRLRTRASKADTRTTTGAFRSLGDMAAKRTSKVFCTQSLPFCRNEARTTSGQSENPFTARICPSVVSPWAASQTEAPAASHAVTDTLPHSSLRHLANKRSGSDPALPSASCTVARCSASCRCLSSLAAFLWFSHSWSVILVGSVSSAGRNGSGCRCSLRAWGAGRRTSVPGV
mmetsp:Transcript_6976/g.16651  ORF Transcript_6976/g.16651 Transcript_6976/m.16651 type:complete len:293 (-) Transcript_6976:1220-2098(-)